MSDKLLGAVEVYCAPVMAFDMIDGTQVDVTVRVPFDMVRGLAIGEALKVGRICERCDGTGSVSDGRPEFAGFRNCEKCRGFGDGKVDP
jgi:DnaJ-class molecular chaperone